MTFSSVNDHAGFCDAVESHSNNMEGSISEKELAETKRRLDEFSDQLRYVYENIASEVYAFGECHCDPVNGACPCPRCAAEHFVNWFRAQEEFEKYHVIPLDEG